ncbi:MAG: hypothetical protein JNK50_14380 [Bacteroidia bacterium]|nr:hypothetical protein [Bacteroidia bacterium]
MKNFFLFALTFATIGLIAQPSKNKAMSIAPTFGPGYYISLKGDTVKGEVRNNMDNESDYANSFMFRKTAASKAMPLDSKKAKGYGVDDRHYSSLKMDDKDVYIKYLEQGRLNLFEYTYLSKEGPKAVYLIVDSRATEEDKTGTHFMIQLDEKQFKKQLKPYFKDQPMLLEQVDKWFLKIDEIRKAVKEFNGMYP